MKELEQDKLEERMRRSNNQALAALAATLGFIGGALTVHHFEDPIDFEVRDVNKDEIPDIIYKTNSGERVYYGYKHDGNVTYFLNR